MANAVIYARYSSAGQREESIEDQVRVCRQAAERDGAAIARVYHDDATTGRTAEGRDGFLRMVADARRGLFDVVYVYKLDRFARNRYDAAVYKAKLRRCGVELRSATEAVGDGPESILLESMLEGLAEYYSVALAENVKRGQLGNAMKCKHNGVRTYGYDLGEDGYYHVNEEEAAVVRRMFRMYADGASMPEIAAAMPEARTKMGKPLSVGFISKSLRLEKYRGVYSYGQTRVEGGMPAIVDGELFEGVQGMLAARARRRRSTMEYLLSGKLFDAEGHRYQSSSGHGKSGRKYTYYRCPATGHQVPQHVLEDAVAKAAADVIAADDDAVEAIVAMVMAAQAEEMADSIAAADATRKRLEQNAREQSRVVDLAAKTGAVDAVAAKLGQLADEREELEASLAEMELSCAMVDEERAEFWVRRLMGRSDQLEAVRLFVDRVVLDREAGEMRVAFSFDGIKKNPHQAESDGGSRNCRLAERLFRGFAHMQLRAAPRSRARCSCCRACLRVRRARYPRVRCAYIPRRPTRSKRIRLASLGMSRLAVHAPFALRVRFAVARVVDLVGISYEAGTRISVVASATRPKQRDRVVYRRKRGAVMVFR